MSFSIRTFVILSTCFFFFYFSSDSDDDENCCHQCCDCLKNCLNEKNDENSFSSENNELDNNNNNDIISNSNNDYNNNKMMNNFVQNNNNNNNPESLPQNQTFNKVQNINPNYNNNQINNNNQPVQAANTGGFNQNMNNKNMNSYPQNIPNVNNPMQNQNNNNNPMMNNFVQNNNNNNPGFFPQNLIFNKGQNFNPNHNNNQINNNNNSNDANNKDIIKLEYQLPPNIGLNNVGATCFMNSTLQCLSHTKRLTNYFLNSLNQERILKNNIAIKNPGALQLTPLYLELISKLWNKDGSKTYSPYNFMNGVQSMNPIFQRGQAGDAKDFIIFILEQMHRELKKNILKNKVELEPLNQYDKSNAFQHFFTEFQADVSIISDIFFGINETTNICLNCKNVYGSNGQNYPICYNYGIFNCIIFPLEKVKEMKNQFMQLYGIQDNRGLNAMNNDRVSLIECFIYNQKTDKFTGDNQNYCNVCRKLQDSDYTSKIYISPNVLVLILNRGKGNIYDVKLDFAENIDVTDFISLREKPRISYNLYGVITHLGKSGPYAHFVASCKSPVDGAWYRFNDGLVSPIKNFQTEVHDYGNPYILFYQKDDF